MLLQYLSTKVISLLVTSSTLVILTNELVLTFPSLSSQEVYHHLYFDKNRLYLRCSLLLYRLASLLNKTLRPRQLERFNELFEIRDKTGKACPIAYEKVENSKPQSEISRAESRKQKAKSTKIISKTIIISKSQTLDNLLILSFIYFSIPIYIPHPILIS